MKNLGHKLHLVLKPHVLFSPVTGRLRPAQRGHSTWQMRTRGGAVMENKRGCGMELNMAEWEIQTKRYIQVNVVSGCVRGHCEQSGESVTSYLPFLCHPWDNAQVSQPFQGTDRGCICFYLCSFNITFFWYILFGRCKAEFPVTPVTPSSVKQHWSECRCSHELTTSFLSRFNRAWHWGMGQRRVARENRGNFLGGM